MMPVVGNKYGKLTILSFAEGQKTRGYSVICQCDCGQIISLGFGELRTSRTSCGICYKQYLNDIIGKRFTNLVVKSCYTKNKRTYCVCKCDCGKDTVVVMSKLKNKHTKSCGCGLYYRPKPEEASKNELIAQYKRSATKRKYDFNLSNDELTYLFRQNCYYCGQRPKSVFKTNRSNSDFIYNGIDRIDNTKGYIIDNVVTCCGTCNWMKLEKTEQDFLQKITDIYNHRCKELNH